MVQFEKEICMHLSIPSIPLKKWDGKTTFKNGVAVTKLASGTLAYAVCSFSNGDKAPNVTKVFSQEPFNGIEEIYIVPSFMDTDVDKMDLDDDSKKAAEILVNEAQDLSEQKDDDINMMKALPEWIFDEITNKDEAQAWLRQYNATNKIKGRIPENEETLKMRLLNIHSKLKRKTQ